MDIDQSNFHSKGNEILILGIGNYLMGDEGVGIHFSRKLEEEPFFKDKNITILDGGTGGFLLVPYLEAHPHVIIVDATMDKKPLGTVSLLKPKFSSDFPSSLSAHDFGLKDMVEILTLFDKMPTVYLYTVTINEIKPMFIGMSKKVEEAIPIVLEKVKNTIKEIENGFVRHIG
ncbi:MAG: hydrogenase maturation protease [Flavobacteriales bacterium]